VSWECSEYLNIHDSSMRSHSSNEENHNKKCKRGKWQYIFLFSHLKEHLKLFNNFFYRFFISCFVLEIFSLEVMRCQPSWIHFLSHYGSFGDVTTGINHINVFVADQILIGRCFKGFKWSWYLQGHTEYNFECKMISGCLDKSIVWPLLWRIMHIYKNPRWRTFHFFRLKTFVEGSKIWKNGKRVLYMVLNVLSNEKIKNILPFPCFFNR
jgi:hypothetical protein